MEKVQSASVLAFEKKIVNSDGTMRSGVWSDRDASHQWPRVTLREKAVRGTVSNRLKKAGVDIAKFNAQMETPNLQTVDTATLPFEQDTLKISFSCRFLSGLQLPSVCNSPSFQARVAEVVGGYLEEHGMLQLAKLYAQNIVNGRWAWRNRVGAQACEVRVQLHNGTILTFDSFNFSLRTFQNQDDKLELLASYISDGLIDEEANAFMTVDCFVKLGEGQEIYPSQELILSENKDAKGGKSKVLYALQGGAAMHSQKIGNALRTIDIWHPAVNDVGPIAVEPYGAVTSRGTAYRIPKETKLDFYTLFDNWMLKGKEPETNQQHYVMAILIRGGVFGKAD